LVASQIPNLSIKLGVLHLFLHLVSAVE